jgi:iron complex outermembrane recepter protein
MRKIWLLSVAPLALLVGGEARAQVAGPTPAAATTDLDEIVVTARKQVENVESVPATVEVVGQAEIARVGLTSFSDISKIAPNINISNAPAPNLFAVTMRGIGSAPGNPSFDPSVAPYVDGVFTPRDREFTASLFDIKNIETISGTQTALLGKNSSLGAINLVTNKPGDSFEIDARYQHEFELGSDRVEGGFDVPVGDTLKFRVAGLYDGEGQPVQDVITGQYGRTTQSAGRVTAVWNPTSTVDVTGMFQVQSGHSSGTTAQLLTIVGTAPGMIAADFGYPGTPTTQTDKAAMYSPVLGGDASGDGQSQRGAITANWRLGGYTLTSQSGYTESQANAQGNLAFLPGNAYLQYVNDNGKQFTQELRLASPVGPRLDYIVGLFYLYGQYINYTTQGVDYPAGTALPIPLTGKEVTYFNQIDRANSAFGQANYQIFDPLKLTVGLRYTNETKDADFSRTTLTPGLYTTIPGLETPFAPFSLSESKGNLDGSVGLNYKVNSDILFYVSWGQGTKAGGYAQAVGNLRDSEYLPEVAQTAEVGLKAQLFEHDLTLNGDYFDTYVHDFQLVTFVGTNFDVGNTDARSRGFESTVNWAPVRDFHLYWNNVYADTYDAHIGSNLPFAPRWSGLVGGTYDRDMFGSLRGDIDVNVDYRSQEISQQIQAGTPYLLPPLQALTRLNVSVGLGSPAQGWEVRLIGQNLTDEHAYGFNFPIPLVKPGGGANAAGIPLSPMTIKLQVSFKH